MWDYSFCNMQKHSAWSRPLLIINKDHQKAFDLMTKWKIRDATFQLQLKWICLSLPVGLFQEENKECAALLYIGMENGWLRPVVGAKYPLADAAKAHHDIIESSGASGKIVLTMWLFDHIRGQEAPRRDQAVHWRETFKELPQQDNNDSY